MNSESILFLDWRVRSGVETHAARCLPIGQGRFGGGRPPIGNPSGRAHQRHYPREAPCPYRRIRTAGLSLDSDANALRQNGSEFIEPALEIGLQLADKVRQAGAAIPAISRNVAAKSISDTILLLTLPGGVTPGQRIINGVRNDSSKIHRLSNHPCSPR